MGRKKGFGHVYRRGSIWWIKYHRNGQPIFESSHSERKEDANELLKARIADKRPVIAGKVLVDELLDDLLADYELNNPKSFKDFAVPFVEPKGAKKNLGLRHNFGMLRVEQVTTDRLRAFQLKLKRADAAEATINRKMSLLRRAFIIGAEATPPKVSTIPKFPMFSEKSNARQGFLEFSAFQRLLEELPEELQPVTAAAYYTGARKGELLAIRRSQLDLNNAVIDLRRGETKNSEPRVLPLYGRLLDILRDHEVMTGSLYPKCKWLFHRQGEQILDFRQAWLDACERSGQKGLLFHDLRRSAVRNMIRAGIPLHTVQRISGHKTADIIRRYDIQTLTDVKDAGVKAAAYLEAQAK